jgi:hypothetical protein
MTETDYLDNTADSVQQILAQGKNDLDDPADKKQLT